MAKRWFWRDGSDDYDVCYEVCYLEDDNEHAVPFGAIYTKEDAERVIQAMRWMEAFESGRVAMPLRRPATKPRVKPRRATAKAKK